MRLGIDRVRCTVFPQTGSIASRQLAGSLEYLSRHLRLQKPTVSSPSTKVPPLGVAAMPQMGSITTGNLAGTARSEHLASLPSARRSSRATSRAQPARSTSPRFPRLADHHGQPRGHSPLGAPRLASL